jgi:hypothetical protein
VLDIPGKEEIVADDEKDEEEGNADEELPDEVLMAGGHFRPGFGMG